MLKSAKYRNIQSHKKSLLLFDKGVTAIVGVTDSGKSALLRGLYWALFNKPSGADYRSSWSKFGYVEVETAENSKIRRKKASSNDYFLNGSAFKAFKTDVPKEIEEAVGMNRLNWQSQLDPHFLLSASSGEVARTLNEVVNLEEIDSSLSKANQSVQKNSAEKENNKAMLLHLEDTLKGYAYLEPLEKTIKCLNIKTERLGTCLQKISDLEVVLEEIEVCEEYLTKLPDLDKINLILSAIEKVLEYSRGIETRQKIVKMYLSSLEENQSEINTIDAQIEQVQSKIDKAMKDGCPMCGRK